MNSDSELVSPVLSSALLCESHMCGGLYNKSQLVRISLHHRHLKVNVTVHKYELFHNSLYRILRDSIVCFTISKSKCAQYFSGK